MMDINEETRLIDEAAAKFPEQFGLRAFPGKVFCISKSASYCSEISGVMLYTYRLRKDGTWGSFCKATPAELGREIVILKEGT